MDCLKYCDDSIIAMYIRSVTSSQLNIFCNCGMKRLRILDVTSQLLCKFLTNNKYESQ